MAAPLDTPLPAPADIGVSTSAWSELLLDKALGRIAELATAAEIRSFGLHTLLSPRNRRAAQAAGLTYSVHGPFGHRGLGDTDERVRRKVLDEHRRHIEAAGHICATAYVAHPDWQPGMGPRNREVLAALERSFAELAELQRETAVEILVENMPGADHSHFTHPGDLDLQGLGLTLDAGHAAVSGCLADWLADPQAPLRHVHLHDNHGAGDTADPHLPLGAGVMDAAAVMAAARAAGADVVLEHDCEEHVVASLVRLRELGLLA